MVSRKELFDECMNALSTAGIDTARFDTLCIFQDMLGDLNPLFLPEEEVPEETAESIRQLTELRCQNRPLQYLLGQWEFYGCPVKVGEGVLIPRPDTETLVDQVLEICRRENMTSPKIADLCSGSGCIAIALKKQLPGAEVYAVEVSEEALPYLRENVRMNGTDICIIPGDVLKKETQQKLSGLDIIVSNPPYLTADEMRSLQKEVTFEPALALFGGSDGLGFYRAIAELWRKSLKTGGYMAFEFGDEQHEAVGGILRTFSFDDIQFCRDGGGNIRTAAAVKTGEQVLNYSDSTVSGHKTEV